MNETTNEERPLITHGSSPINPSEEEGKVHKPPTTTTYSQLTAYAVSVNYIIGAGVLGLPFATYEAGVPLTLTTLVFFSVFLVLGCWWILEILSRAQGVYDGTNKNRIESNEKFSYSRFCELFGGSIGKICSQIVIGCYCLGALWAYTASFSSSLAMVLFEYAAPEQPSCNIYHNPTTDCKITYFGSVLFYSLIVIPLSLMEITEQQILQIVLTFYRFIVFGIMLITAGIGLIINGPMNNQSHNSTVWNFKWSGFSIMFPSAALALCVHYNVPDVVTPCKEKSNLKRIVSLSQITALAFYAAIGCVCAIFFNPPDPLITLNWLQFTGRGSGGWGTEQDPVWWAIILRLSVILFPVIDLVNVFPLVVVTLSSNISALLPSKWTIKQRKYVSRLCSAIPPLILGAAVGKLDKIFTIAGMFGFAIEFIIPTVFHYLSSRACVGKFGKGADNTPYSGWYSKPIIVWFTLFIGISALICALTFTIMSWNKMNEGIDEFVMIRQEHKEQTGKEKEEKHEINHGITPESSITSIPELGEVTAKVLFANAYISTIKDLAQFPTQFPGIYSAMTARGEQPLLSSFIDFAQKICKKD